MTVVIKGGFVLLTIWVVVTVLFLLSYRSSVPAEDTHAEDLSG